MKLTLNIEDHKVPFFLELLKNFEEFVKIERDSDIVIYDAIGKPLTSKEFKEKVMRGYEDVKNGRTSSTEELIELAKSM